MGQIPSNLLRHTMIVRRYLGATASGPSYGTAELVECFVEHKRRMVRTVDRREVLSATTAYCAPDTVDIPPESEIDVPAMRGYPARTTTVIMSTVHDGGGLPTPDHVEVNLI